MGDTLIAPETERLVEKIETFLQIFDDLCEGKPINMLNKKAILAAQDIKSEMLHVPEWGGDVMVYGMTGSQRDEFEASIVEMKGKTQTMHMQNLRAKLCAMCIRDEDGRRMFDSDEVDELGAKSAQALQRIFDAAQRLSGLATEDVEKLAKNSGSEASGVSGSASL